MQQISQVIQRFKFSYVSW